MANELLWALEDARGDAERARRSCSPGEGKAFCAGGDFAQMTAGADAVEAPAQGRLRRPAAGAARKSDKPVVARVNGHAMGGGLGMVAASTFAVASTDAKLGTPEIDVGLFPMMIMAVLARIVPRRRLLEMMLLGREVRRRRRPRASGIVNRARGARASSTPR